MITFWVLVITVLLMVILLGVLFGIALVYLVRYVVIKIANIFRSRNE